MCMVFPKTDVSQKIFSSKLPYVLFWETVHRLLNDTSRRHHPSFLHHAMLIIEILVKEMERKRRKKKQKEKNKKEKNSNLLK